MELLQLVRKNIRSLKPYSSARSEFKGSAEVFLDANENPYETGLNRYPDPLQRALKKEIAAFKGVHPEQIFLGNGSDEAIDLLIRIFCEPRVDQIMILPPTYGMYRVAADIADVSITEVPLRADFQPDVAGVLAKATPQTKLLFLCSPNNPTGNSFDPAIIEELLMSFSGIVVIDEAYIDFSEQESFTKLIALHPKLVVMQTFSKAWGLAGIRLGMAFAQARTIQLFNKVKPPYNINQLTQNAALEALQNKAQYENWLHEILVERQQLEEALKLLPMVQKVYPSDANFLLVKVDAPNKLYQYLIEEKIIVRNRSTVLLCEGCLRITVGRPEENRRLLEGLKKYQN